MLIERDEKNYSCRLNKVISMFLVYMVQTPYVLRHVKKMLIRDFWRNLELTWIILLLNCRHSSETPTRFLFSKSKYFGNHPEHRNSIFIPISKKKTVYFIQITWLQTIAEIPTDMISIIVEYKYANYVTFQIKSS